MSTSLGNLTLDGESTLFFSEHFKTILEQNLEYIKAASFSSSPTVGYKQLIDSEAAACEGDFRKVACYLDIPHHLVWITMRINGYHHYEEYRKDKREIILPDLNTIYKLKLDTTTTQTNI